MNALPLAAGDIGSVIGAILVVVFIVIRVISQITASLREAQRPRPGSGGPILKPGGQPVLQPGPGQPGGSASDPLSREIDEFLQRAARRREGGPPATNEPPVPVDPAAGPFRPPRQPLRWEEPVEAQVIEESPTTSVAEHVRRRMSSPQFGRLDSDLGKEVAQADEKIEHRLQSVFSHKVSRLSDQAGETSQSPVAQEAPLSQDRVTRAPNRMAADIAALLSNRATVRQAILLGEILNRPESRWTRRR